MRQYTDHCVNRKLKEAIERWIKSEQPMTQLTLTFPIMILQRKQGQSWVGNGVFSTDLESTKWRCFIAEQAEVV